MGWLNSKRFAPSAEFHATTAVGPTVPRKKMSCMSCVSAVALPALIVKLWELVPPMVVEAALMELTAKVSRYALRQ